jgi:hypothetical protein
MGTTCAICGKEAREGKMIVRRLNGRNHYCCCLRCEVTWEKENLIGVSG